MDAVAHIHRETVTSTLTEAWDLAANGQSLPFWLTAGEQTQGRGRLQRNWVSKLGNLYSTLVIQAPDREKLPLVPFAVALGVSDAILASIPGPLSNQVSLKWPNDVLIDGAKTSGILIEHRVQGALPLLAIGMGVNVEHAPQLPDRRTTCVVEHESSANVESVFSHLRRTLMARLNDLVAKPEAIVPAWLSRAQGVGEPITVIDGKETLEGTFDHLADDGALMLRLPSGAMRPIHTGDVVIKPR